MRCLLCLAAVAPFVSEIAAGLAFGRKTSFETRRIGRARRDALDVLSGSSDTKDIRRAETAWRQAWTKAQVAPPIQEAVVAIRALGAVRDGNRLTTLVRALERREYPKDEAHVLWSSAISAFAFAGKIEEAQALLAKRSSSADALAIALAADTATCHAHGVEKFRDDAGSVVIRKVLAMQRLGHVDLHGLNASEVTLLLCFLLEDDIQAQLPIPRRVPLRHQGVDGLIVVTGRGAHSSNNTSPVRTKALDALAQYPQIDAAPLEGNNGAFVLRRKCAIENQTGGTVTPRRCKQTQLQSAWSMEDVEHVRSIL